jgi:hypothetical protein
MVHAHDLSEPWQAQRRGQGWFLLLIGVVVFALFGAVVGYAYMRGLPGIGGEPPVIRAAEGPYRTAPADRGGLAVPNAKSNIVTVLRPQNEPPRVERLLPAERAAPLESPEPETVEEPPVAVLSAPESAAPPTPAAAPTAEPAVAPEDAGTAVTGAPFPRSRPAPPEPVAEVAPEQPTISALPQIEPAAAPPAAVVPEPPAPPSVPPAAQAEPRPQPAATPPNPTQDMGNGEPQRLVRTAPTTLATVRPAAGGGIYRLQLAAVRSEGGLTQAWADLRQRYPVALGGVNPQVERTDTTSGPLFRLQAGPFGSREAAADACSTIRGSGGQCFIVGPIAQ